MVCGRDHISSWWEASTSVVQPRRRCRHQWKPAMFALRGRCRAKRRSLVRGFAPTRLARWLVRGRQRSVRSLGVREPQTQVRTLLWRVAPQHLSLRDLRGRGTIEPVDELEQPCRVCVALRRCRLSFEQAYHPRPRDARFVPHRRFSPLESAPPLSADLQGTKGSGPVQWPRAFVNEPRSGRDLSSSSRRCLSRRKLPKARAL